MTAQLVAVHYMSDWPDNFEIFIGMVLDKFLGERLKELESYNCAFSYITKQVPDYYAIKLEIFAEFPNENDRLVYTIKYPKPRTIGVPVGQDHEYTT